MKLLVYVKTTLKGIVSSLPITIGCYVLFPIVLASAMSFLLNGVDNSDTKVKKVEFQIVDNDKSEYSKSLITMLKTDELKEYIKISKDSENKVIIPKGYENTFTKNDKHNVIIEQKDADVVSQIIKSCVDNYNKSVALLGQTDNQEIIEKALKTNTVLNKTIKNTTSKDNSQLIITSCFGFVITMLIMSFTLSNYKPEAKNLAQRNEALPISKMEYLLYESISTIIYSFIMMFSYVFVYRLMGKAFTGNLALIILVILAVSVLIAGIASCIYYLFGEKIAQVIGMLLYIVPLIGGEMFTGETTKLSLASITHYVNNLLIDISNNSFNFLSKDNLIILAIPSICFLLAIIKIKVCEVKRKWA